MKFSDLIDFGQLYKDTAAYCNDKNSSTITDNSTAKDGRNQDDAVDAFRHAYTSALWAYKIGDSIAEVLGLGREAGALWNSVTRKGSNMDLYNNRVGRQIGEEVKDALKDKNPTDKEIKDTIAKKIMEAHEKGDLISNPKDARDWRFDVRDYKGKITAWINIFDAATQVVRRDPLIFDLDGDGLETLSTDNGVYFDHDANGFAEQTGWVGADDGLIVMDRDNDGVIEDGTELFGDQTILKTGKTASDGFEALAEWDDNKDGKIDANDAIWSKLKIWQDADGDGYSSSSELFTLDEAGITAINLGSVTTNTSDGNGNTITQQGTYAKSDGTMGIMGDLALDSDTAYTIADTWLDVPDDIAGLPDLQGYGTVYDLHQAMVRDTTGTLKSLVEQFIAATDVTTRNSLMEQILFKWTGADTVSDTSRGSNFSAKKLAVLEALVGKSFVGVSGSNPNDLAAPLLAQAYEGIFEMFYSQLMAQTHLKYVYDAITYSWDESSQSLKGDLTGAIAAIQNAIASDPSAANDAVELMRTIHGMKAEDTFDLVSLSTTFALNDEDANWQIDSAGKTVLTGTVLNDTLYATAGVDTAIRGDLGNDALYGSTGNVPVCLPYAYNCQHIRR